MSERIRAIAQTEITNHYAEAERLTGVAHDLLGNADWHLAQGKRWEEYAQGLGGNALAEVIPFPVPRTALEVVEGGA